MYVCICLASRHGDVHVHKEKHRIQIATHQKTQSIWPTESKGESVHAEVLLETTIWVEPYFIEVFSEIFLVCWVLVLLNHCNNTAE